MGQDHAKFTAEIVKDFKTGDNIELKLRIPLKQGLPHLVFLAQHQSKEVNVFIGDPQMAWNFSDEDEDAMYRNLTGRFVTTDASGVVIGVEKKEEDENQGNLFEGEGQSEQENGEDEKTGETDQPDVEGAGATGTEGERTGLGDDIPEWMKGIDGPEMDFDKDGQGAADQTPEDQDKQEPVQPEGEGQQQDATGEITKEQIEEYILNLKPTFPDIDLDFPNLVEKRRNGATWLSLSRELGIPSSQLNTKFKKYKDKVKDLMQGAGVA